MAELDAAAESNKDGPSPSSPAANLQTSNLPAEAAATTESATPEASPAQPGVKPTTEASSTTQSTATMAVEVPELDDFGLPVRQYTNPIPSSTPTPMGERFRRISGASPASQTSSRKLSISGVRKVSGHKGEPEAPDTTTKARTGSVVGTDADRDNRFNDTVSSPASGPASPIQTGEGHELGTPTPAGATSGEVTDGGAGSVEKEHTSKPTSEQTESQTDTGMTEDGKADSGGAGEDKLPEKIEDKAISESKKDPMAAGRGRGDSSAAGLGVGVSEFSHQVIIQEPKKEDERSEEWQCMPAYASYDMYDDDNRLIAKEHHETADDKYGYSGLGGAGKGYTRVLLDDDAESATSMDENTQYLFKDAAQTTSITEDDEAQRDAVSQLQATKNLLTEGQRIAYVGLTRLELSSMVKEIEGIQVSRRVKKEVQTAVQSMQMWSQKMMIRLYTHMDISPAEQIMIEQLNDHGVMPKDLTPLLMANARVKNPMAEAERDSKRSSVCDEKSSRPSSVVASPSPKPDEEEVATPPPPYSANANEEELSIPVRTPSELPTTDKIDIDLRWTVLCDLFLVLIADSVYDARSRVLLEKVGKALEIPWLDIYRFEKKVTDALEMQQNAEKENWNEEQHMENRRKMALKRRYVMMGLATVGGGLVIGLSAGLLAPVIGAGLAAGFTTIGVTGTSGFLAGAGGAAIITSSAAASGSAIGVRAANRRTGAVKTFEYRPLHNNKRVNLIVTVSGWMAGKVDDVRLPYSTVDPVMGDIYSVLWEPEMLTSMGDTINILATEVSYSIT